MAHFRGSIQGSRGEVSRLAGKNSGLSAYLNSWQGGVHVYLYERDGEDFARVQLNSGSGHGGPLVDLYDGPIDSAARGNLAIQAA